MFDLCGLFQSIQLYCRDDSTSYVVESVVLEPMRVCCSPSPIGTLSSI